MTNWMKDLDSSPNAMHVAWMGELVFAGASESDRAGRTVRFSVVRSDVERGQAHPFAQHTLRRKGFAGTRFQMSLSPLDPGKDHLMEVLLLGWTDGPRGATVTFLLSPEGSVHPFLGCDRPGKGVNPSRWMSCFVELNDEDAPVNQVQRAKVEVPKKAQRLSNVAAQMIKNPVFWSFIKSDNQHCVNAMEADDHLKLQLGISSKADLDRGGQAEVEFNLLRVRFVAWQLENGYDPTR